MLDTLIFSLKRWIDSKVLFLTLLALLDLTAETSDDLQLWCYPHVT